MTKKYPEFIYTSRQMAISLIIAVLVGGILGLGTWYFVLIALVWYLSGAYVLYNLFKYKGDDGELWMYKWVHLIVMFVVTGVLYLFFV